jgi:DNA polymerase I-like protein with 3'-5' exonuclease and polymerase domains
MFVPDAGHLFWDGDLDRADLQVVAWESNDEQLKAALRTGADIHLLNAYVLAGREPPDLDELRESHPNYGERREPLEHQRQFAKVFCHGTNYGGRSRTLAVETGRTVAEVERAQRIWFGAHPGIRDWHEKVQQQITAHRYVENKFGYRWYIFDRVDAVLPEALAWIPQSTVSIVINRIWLNIYENLPQVEVLLQVHDSLCGQFPAALKDVLLPQILAQAQVTVPYEDPLVIPFTIKTSASSWGDVHAEVLQ